MSADDAKLSGQQCEKAEEEADSWSQAHHSQTLLAPPAHKEGKEASNAEWKLKMARTSKRKRLPPGLRCPGRTVPLLCALRMKDRSHERRWRG